MEIIKLENITLKYKEGFSFLGSKSKTAIDNLSLSIKQGENVGIIGGNGAGKSTLLKVIAGIYSPNSGKVITHRPIRSVFIGLQSGFISYLNGVQNIYLTGYLLGMNKKEIKEKFQDIINYAELGEALYKPLFTYSSGMRARLAFSVSVFSDPDLLLLDEVMGVGDKDFRGKSNETLQDMIHGKAAVVMVSHEMDSLKKVCDQAVWFDKGKVKSLGKCEDVISAYQSE